MVHIEFVRSFDSCFTIYVWLESKFYHPPWSWRGGVRLSVFLSIKGADPLSERSNLVDSQILKIFYIWYIFVL